MTNIYTVLSQTQIAGSSITENEEVMALGHKIAAANRLPVEFMGFRGFSTSESRAAGAKLLAAWAVSSSTFYRASLDSEDDEYPRGTIAVDNIPPQREVNPSFPWARKFTGLTLFWVTDNGVEGYLVLLSSPGDGLRQNSIAHVAKIGNPSSGIVKVFEEAINAVRVDQVPEDKEKPANIYALVASSGGVNIQSIGRVGQTLERGNYMPDVLDAFDMAVADIRSEEPSGRIAIFNGPPGSGKTHLVKSIMQECSGGVNFIMVNPDDVRTMTSPTGLTSLISFSQSYSGRMVLVLEDADSVLVPRGVDNMHSISTLLNLTDGIWGAALDLRVLATTNAKSLEFDSAITRPGRLTVMKTVGNLDAERANAAYKRLTGSEGNLGPSTLAEVYAAAGGRAVKKVEKKFGFGV